MKMHTLLGAAAVATMATAASADVELEFENFQAAGSQFGMVDVNPVAGVLDMVVADFWLNADGENWTWCNDLTVLIASDDLSDILVQVGGYSDYGAAHKFAWETGSDGTAGTVGGGNVAIGGLDCTGYYVWLGNGYGGGGVGDWSGAIDLTGSIDYVPAPGALALLGLGGLVARRRRA